MVIDGVKKSHRAPRYGNMPSKMWLPLRHGNKSERLTPLTSCRGKDLTGRKAVKSIEKWKGPVQRDPPIGWYMMVPRYCTKFPRVKTMGTSAVPRLSWWIPSLPIANQQHACKSAIVNGRCTGFLMVFDGFWWFLMVFDGFWGQYDLICQFIMVRWNSTTYHLSQPSHLLEQSELSAMVARSPHCGRRACANFGRSVCRYVAHKVHK